jgi:hypothetical protein
MVTVRGGKQFLREGPMRDEERARLVKAGLWGPDRALQA